MAEDLAQQLLQMQALISSSASNGKPAFLFGVIPLDINVGGGLSATSMSPLAKNIPALFAGSGGKSGGLADKFLQAIQSIPDELRKRAQDAGVMYSGDMPGGGSMGGGGSFAANIGPRGGDMEIG